MDGGYSSRVPADRLDRGVHDDFHRGQHLHHAGLSIPFCGCDPCRGDGQICGLLSGGGGAGSVRLSSVHVRESRNPHRVDLYYLCSSLCHFLLFTGLEGARRDLSNAPAENHHSKNGPHLLYGVFFQSLLSQDLLLGLLFLECHRPSLDIPRLFRNETGARSRVCTHFGA